MANFWTWALFFDSDFNSASFKELGREDGGKIGNKGEFCLDRFLELPQTQSAS